jgi:hypothetical protein
MEVPNAGRWFISGDEPSSVDEKHRELAIRKFSMHADQVSAWQPS